MRGQRYIVPVYLIAVFLLTGCHPEAGSESDTGHDVSRSSASMIAESDIGLHVDETAIVSITPGITIKNGKLSASIRDMPLHQLAVELSQRSGVSVQLISKFPDFSISANFTDYPLETGLRRLLRDLSTIFVYSNIDERRNDERRLVAVLVLPQDRKAGDAIEIKTIDEMVAGLSEQLQPFAPRSDHVVDMIYPEIDPAMEEALFELGEYLGNNVSDATRH